MADEYRSHMQDSMGSSSSQMGASMYSALGNGSSSDSFLGGATQCCLNTYSTSYVVHNPYIFPACLPTCQMTNDRISCSFFRIDGNIYVLCDNTIPYTKPILPKNKYFPIFVYVVSCI